MSTAPIGSFTKISNGGFLLKGYLAKAKDQFPHVDVEHSSTDPLFASNPDDFIEENKKLDPQIYQKLKNKVKKCPQCSKAVAFTMSNCNSCGTDLSSTEISYTNNVFTSFIYGIAKGPFPFTISIRKQSPDFLVLDDLLALCPLHLNIIPTSNYLPDWRYLLKKPVEGLKLVENMFNLCCEVAKTQFLANKEWKTKIIKGGDSLTDEQILSHVASGFNYPPSQYQIHLQFMLSPLVPYHYYSYQNGIHFTYKRFFPVEYVKKILSLNKPYDVKEETSLDEIINHYKELGVDYDAIHKESYDRYGKSHETLSQWQESDFEGIVVNGSYYKFGEKGVEEVKNEDVNALNNNDKLILQNYGRPYKGGKPSGTYYKYAKKVEEKNVIVW